MVLSLSFTLMSMMDYVCMWRKVLNEVLSGAYGCAIVRASLVEKTTLSAFPFFFALLVI